MNIFKKLFHTHKWIELAEDYSKKYNEGRFIRRCKICGKKQSEHWPVDEIGFTAGKIKFKNIK